MPLLSSPLAVLATPEDVETHPEPVAKLLLSGAFELPEAIRPRQLVFSVRFENVSRGRGWLRDNNSSSFFSFNVPSASVERHVASSNKLVKTDIMALH